MKLDDGHGSTFAVHFYHATEPAERGMGRGTRPDVRTTWATLHLGPCGAREAGKPCLSRDSVMGKAKCHPHENFDPLEGRKLALARAMRRANLSYDQRAALWKAYFTKTRVRHLTHVDRMKATLQRVFARMSSHEVTGFSVDDYEAVKRLV